MADNHEHSLKERWEACYNCGPIAKIGSPLRSAAASI